MTPWEERSALLATVWQAVTDPTGLYRTVEKQGPIAKSVVYGILVGSTGTILGVAWQLVATGLLDLAGIQQPEGPSGGPFAVIGTNYVLVGTLVFSPFLVALALFLGAGVDHLCLTIVGGARHGYDATLRALAYAQTASLATVIPVCGGLIGVIWGLALTVIGLREVHETTTGKALAAVLLPIAVCCGLGALVFLLVFYLASP